MSNPFRIGPIAAAAILLAAAPALARTQNEAADGSTAQRTARSGEQLICVRDQLTGSRMMRTICKTEREWEAQGGLDRVR